MAPTSEFITEFTLVENPIKGISREITLKEAREIITDNNLRRFVVKQEIENECDGRATLMLGAVWDTETQEFKRRYSVEDQPWRLRRRFNLTGPNLKKKTAAFRERINRWLRHVTTVYKHFLHGRIDTMFKEHEID